MCQTAADGQEVQHNIIVTNPAVVTHTRLQMVHTVRYV